MKAKIQTRNLRWKRGLRPIIARYRISNRISAMWIGFGFDREMEP